MATDKEIEEKLEKVVADFIKFQDTLRKFQESFEIFMLTFRQFQVSMVQMSVDFPDISKRKTTNVPALVRKAGGAETPKVRDGKVCDRCHQVNTMVDKGGGCLRCSACGFEGGCNG